MSGHARGSPAYRRLTLALLVAGFSTFSLLYAVQPLLPLLAAEYRLSAAGAALAVSAATGPLAVAILVAGMVSDRVGRRPLMVAGMIGGAGCTLLAAVAPGWGALLALRVLAGVALAGVPAVAMAYVAEEVEADAVGAAMGLYIAGSALGGMGGRLGASLLADVAGWRWALAAVGAAGLVMADGFRRLAPAGRAVSAGVPRPAARALFADPALPLLFALAFVLMGVFVTVYNVIGFRLLAPPYALSGSTVGAVFVLYLFGSASAAWFGALAGRLGRRRVLPWPIALLIAGVALSAARPLALVVAGVGVLTIGFFGAHAIASAWVGRRAGAARGEAAAWYLFFYYAGSSVLGAAGGVAWARAGWAGVTGWCLLLGLLALGAAALLARVPPIVAPDAAVVPEA